MIDYLEALLDAELPQEEETIEFPEIGAVLGPGAETKAAPPKSAAAGEARSEGREREYGLEAGRREGLPGQDHSDGEPDPEEAWSFGAPVWEKQEERTQKEPQEGAAGEEIPAAPAGSAPDAAPKRTKRRENARERRETPEERTGSAGFLEKKALRTAVRAGELAGRVGDRARRGEMLPEALSAGEEGAGTAGPSPEQAGTAEIAGTEQVRGAAEIAGMERVRGMALARQAGQRRSAAQYSRQIQSRSVRWTLDRGTAGAGETSLSPEGLDRLFQRDARRYDGGFPLF